MWNENLCFVAIFANCKWGATVKIFFQINGVSVLHLFLETTWIQNLHPSLLKASEIVSGTFFIKYFQKEAIMKIVLLGLLPLHCHLPLVKLSITPWYSDGLVEGWKEGILLVWRQDKAKELSIHQLTAIYQPSEHVPGDWPTITKGKLLNIGTAPQCCFFKAWSLKCERMFF